MLDVALKKNNHTLFKLLNYPMWLCSSQIVTTHATLFDSLNP